MRKILGFLLMIVALSLTLAGPAVAGSSTDAALALGAFAVFNQIVRGQTIFHNGLVTQETVVVQEPPMVIYAPPPPPAVVYAPPPPPVVVYPNGSYVLQNGYWVWVPNHYYYKHYKRYHHHDDDD